MGVFSRLSDIINSNLNALLDKAEDPEKLVKMIISEMEQTLIEVRSASARTIAEKKELERNTDHVTRQIAQWQEKAELAINKGREDLAKAALKEKNRLEDALVVHKAEMSRLEDAMSKLETDISRLQLKLNEATARRDAMLLRSATLEKHKQVIQQVHAPSFDEAFEKFAAFERKMDQMEAEVEAMSIGRNNSLEGQINQLAADDKIEQQLAELKQKVASN